MVKDKYKHPEIELVIPDKYGWNRLYHTRADSMERADSLRRRITASFKSAIID